MDDTETMEPVRQRREAELEFVAAAYGPDEAWCTTDETDGTDMVHRRLTVEGDDEDRLSLLLTIRMPMRYLVDSPLEALCTVEDTNGINPVVIRAAWKAVSMLVEACRTTANENIGEESVFLVLSRAEEWIEEDWKEVLKTSMSPSTSTSTNCNGGSSVSQTGPSTPTGTSPSQSSATAQEPLILGRRLIYSHHIISKTKRADMKSLASALSLTGYVKIGWPGLIVLEGREEDCVEFYDSMRRWSWKFLVVRGEQQERIPTLSSGASLDGARKFHEFIETDDMSVVAQHCREVGLEALFKTSMKVYDNSNSDNGVDDHNAGSGNSSGIGIGAGRVGIYDTDMDPSGLCYGALVHVDHMNDGKGYRKWLRKAAQDSGCCLLIKQCYPNHDFTKRPRIVVAAVGHRETVSQFLKRWRTSRVDVDSRGKPCLERMMTILHEGPIEQSSSLASVDWDTANVENRVTVADTDGLTDAIEAIGGLHWREALEESLP